MVSGGKGLLALPGRAGRTARPINVPAAQVGQRDSSNQSSVLSKSAKIPGSK